MTTRVLSDLLAVCAFCFSLVYSQNVSTMTDHRLKKRQAVPDFLPPRPLPPGFGGGPPGLGGSGGPVGIPQGIPWLGGPGLGGGVGGGLTVGAGGWGGQEPGGDYDLFKYEFELAKKAIFSVVAPLALLALFKPKLIGVLAGLKSSSGGTGGVPLAVLSSNTGVHRRQRRSLLAEEEELFNLLRVLEKAQRSFQDEEADLYQKQATAEYLQCSGFMDSFCLERVACEFQAQPVGGPQRDVGGLILESLLSNVGIPSDLKRRLRKASAEGQRGQNCARYWCHKLDRLTSRNRTRVTGGRRTLKN